ncbi:NADPH dehydrogenase [Lentibacillus kapialis]|uniref:NADPH dehydrogenase n=1 Tax=Lentibacillus kapialis TaxID=340214 RepID=A0A917PWG4_9BACI|nr:NADPH dehydrogenase NamA [Lentibacillus kapialis]GGJ94457.1 NADPH dehydrogenase [Lentibacillus kapialis]
MTKLFSPIEFNRVELKNRIVMSPMCMYSCVEQDGKITPFHETHYISRAVGQAGLIMTEATAVVPEGRISHEDVGIWDDEHIEGLKRLNEQLHRYGAKTGIQLAHAGRKARLDSEIFAPSPLAFGESSKTPVEMTKADISNTIKAFKDGAERAQKAGFDIIELHGAHGYLINQFLSPMTNKRHDEYGGSRKNRYRFMSQLIEAVKTVWEGPLFARISTNEYDPNGNTLDDILYFAGQMKQQGIDLIDCSSGGVVPAAVKRYPGYQLKRCETIKQEASLPTGAVGLITTGIQAEEILQNDRADLVLIGRALLRNPYWAKAVADELNETLPAPHQYERGWQ